MLEIIRRSDHYYILFTKPYSNNYFLAFFKISKVEINGISLRSMMEEELNSKIPRVLTLYIHFT